MLEAVRIELSRAIADALAAGGVSADAVALEVPPRRELGDLSWAGALPLAKTLRRPPRAIAEEVAAHVTAAVTAAAPGDALARLEPTARAEGPGFLNFSLRRGPALAHLLRVGPGSRTAAQAGAKTIVEHTNINPNKAAHIGHLRNAVLGDTLVRCLRFLGHAVEVQDYIDDTGVQVADVVVGFLFLPASALAAAVAAVWPEMPPGGSRADVLGAFARRHAAGTLVGQELGESDFDDLCWEIYPRVTRRYDEDTEFAPRRAEILHAIEGGFPQALTLADAVAALAAAGGAHPDAAASARFAAAVAEANLRCHLVTMARLAIAYDVLPHESDILHRGFWERARELLARAGAIRLESEGKNAGCWVMSLAEAPEFAGMADADKILVRSNGTVTYTGKDIAYQLWKLGLLRDDDGTVHDFGYRLFARFDRAGSAAPIRYGEGERALYRTASDPTERPSGAAFGAGARVYNVIDVRQSYPQKVVREAIRVLGHDDAAENSIHFAYEMVALTPAAVRRVEQAEGCDFGLSAEDMAKPFIEMSGRRGIGVKADSLLATLVREAKQAIVARQGDAHPGDEALTVRARAIAVGALRYQMARQSRNRVLAFDFDEALAFEGDTGPYLQYSAVRAHKIFDKLAQQGLAGGAEADAAAAKAVSIPDDLWQLVFACARTPEMVEKSASALEFSLLAGHARELAQLFHKLYHEHPVLHAEDDAARVLRRAVFRLFASTITIILEELLGIPVPAEM
jgi:arginyl-tRNA synthetase